MSAIVRVIIFGSTSDSVIVFKKLVMQSKVRIVAAVTQPTRPIGRQQTPSPTPVETWAKQQAIPVLSFPSNATKPWLYGNEPVVVDTLQSVKPDLLISASYGQKIPTATIKTARFGGLNVHPSLLPRWRGADPVPWAILSGDAQTGVTIVTLADEFDQGLIVAQKTVMIAPAATSGPLRTKLFELGADLLIQILPDYLQEKLKGAPQQSNSLTRQHLPYARRLTRQDGFEPWEKIVAAMQTGDGAPRIERKYLAFTPWPGLWTEIDISGKKKVADKTKKRLKILSVHLSPVTALLCLDSVQLEGKVPVNFAQFRNAYPQASPT